MKFSIFLLVTFALIVICDSQEPKEAETPTIDQLRKLNERLTKKLNNEVDGETVEEYRKNLRSKIDSMGSFDKDRESLKSKLQEKLAEMKYILENALPKESEWYKMQDKPNDEL